MEITYEEGPKSSGVWGKINPKIGAEEKSLGRTPSI